MLGSALSDVTARYRTDEGAEVVRPLAVVDPGRVAMGRPVREPPSHAGQRHYPGLFWSTTNQDHVVYESLLELSWLWLADFDLTVVRIAAQPLHLSVVEGGRTRSRYPDFLFLDRSGDAHVVEVKAPGLMAKPGVRESLEWTARVIRDRGWTYEVWTGADPVVLRNVQFLAMARGPGRVPQADAVAAADLCASAMPLAELEGAVQGLRVLACPARWAVFAALWRGLLRCDLSRPLAGSTLVEVVR